MEVGGQAGRWGGGDGRCPVSWTSGLEHVRAWWCELSRGRWGLAAASIAESQWAQAWAGPCLLCVSAPFMLAAAPCEEGSVLSILYIRKLRHRGLGQVGPG